MSFEQLCVFEGNLRVESGTNAGRVTLGLILEAVARSGGGVVGGSIDARTETGMVVVPGLIGFFGCIASW